MTPFHRPLPGDAHLRLYPEACLAVRGGSVACTACADACPAHVLAIDENGPRLVGNCLHCGRCAVACPSGALMAQGFDEVVLPKGNQPVAVECWRVPAELTAPGAVRIPCLGGLPVHVLLEWQLAIAPRRLVFVNRGGCADCAAGGERFAAESLLATARIWLRECGVAEAAQPSTESRPLPPGRMSRDIPSAASQVTMGRRAFFGRLGREIARSERPVEPLAGPRAAVRRTVCPLPARERLLAALGKLAHAHGRALPARALPAVSVGPACRDHGLCAGLCPTGALTRSESDVEIVLEFEAGRCIACGRCAAHCPEGALDLSDSGGVFERQVVKRHDAASCLECGRTFQRVEPEQKVCGQCESRRNLARNLFGHG